MIGRKKMNERKKRLVDGKTKERSEDKSGSMCRSKRRGMEGKPGCRDDRKEGKGCQGDERRRKLGVIEGTVKVLWNRVENGMQGKLNGRG